MWSSGMGRPLLGSGQALPMLAFVIFGLALAIALAGLASTYEEVRQTLPGANPAEESLTPTATPVAEGPAFGLVS